MDNTIFKSKIGNIEIGETDGKITFLDFSSKAVKVTSNKLLIKASKQIEEYLEGTRENFDLPLSFKGTEFQHKVWKALLKIPYGKTLSYQELAMKVGGKNYSRAVGGAVSKNPIAIIIPCHRILSSNGLGGFAGGLKIKKELLKIEQP